MTTKPLTNLIRIISDVIPDYRWPAEFKGTQCIKKRVTEYAYNYRLRSKAFELFQILITVRASNFVYTRVYNHTKGSIPWALVPHTPMGFFFRVSHVYIPVRIMCGYCFFDSPAIYCFGYQKNRFRGPHQVVCG